MWANVSYHIVIPILNEVFILVWLFFSFSSSPPSHSVVSPNPWSKSGQKCTAKSAACRSTRPSKRTSTTRAKAIRNESVPPPHQVPATETGEMINIKNNAWVTMNNDFWVTRDAICQWFSLTWRRHSWKSFANRLTRDPKIVIHGNECIILFLTCYFISWTHNSAKNNYELSIADFPIVAKDSVFRLAIVTSPQLICDVMRM